MKTVVLDASVGVKWIREEAGTPEALDLLRAQGAAEIQIAVASHFCYEVLSVAGRERAPGRIAGAWEIIRESGATIVEIDDTLVTAAIEQTEALGCSFYDAIAPALATLLDAPLYSADRQSHAAVLGVVLIG